MNTAQCCQEIIRLPLNELAQALESGNHPDLDEFVNLNSDGLGTPLAPEVCINFGLAVAYSKNVIPEYNDDILLSRHARNRERRAQQQRFRRAALRLGESMTTERCRYTHLAPHKNSNIHVVTGALFALHWTGAWHYREQMGILRIMGLYKGDDFIRDRIDYLRRNNPATYENIRLLAAGLRKQRLRE